MFQFTLKMPVYIEVWNSAKGILPKLKNMRALSASKSECLLDQFTWARENSTSRKAC